MSRLIDADELIKAYEREVNGYLTASQCVSSEFCRPYNEGVSAMNKTIKKFVNNAPTVDAVEVVRCKDCKFAEMTTDGRLAKYCDKADTDEYGFRLTQYHDADHFCSYGERRTE